MSLNDKILEIIENWGCLSTEEITRVLKEQCQIDKSPRTIQRHIRQLVEEGELTPDKPRGREQTYSLVERVCVEPTSLWDRLKHSFEQVGGNLVEIKVQKASYAGRDPETGWRVYDYDVESSIEGIMVLKGAVELVATARSAGIYIGNEYDGIVLTSDPIGYKYRLLWKGRLYEVKDVEERCDGYNFSYRIAYLDELVLDGDGKKIASVHMPRIVSDGRNQTKAFLTSYLADANIVRDDGSTEAAYCVIYATSDYDMIMEEFRASSSPVDGLHLIGEPDSRPLIGASQTAYGYEEHVPVFVFTIDKAGITGAKLKRMMEAELRRVCETYPIGKECTRPRLERRRDYDQRLGSTILHSTEFVLNYRHARTSKL